MSVSIIYEDESFLVVDKPSGVSVLADRVSETSLLDEVKKELNSKGEDGFVVHRLDKGTSGVIVFGKTEEDSRSLSMQFEHRTVEKSYLALVLGVVEPREGVIDLPIAVNHKDKTRMMVQARGGKPSVTEYRVVEAFRGYSLVELRPKTGRTHQIRVHLSAIGFPLAVDPLYSSGEGLLLSSFKKGYRVGRREEKPLLDRLALHAQRLSFDHPRTGNRVEFESAIPKDFEIALKVLRKYAK